MAITRKPFNRNTEDEDLNNLDPDQLAEMQQHKDMAERDASGDTATPEQMDRFHQAIKSLELPNVPPPVSNQMEGPEPSPKMRFQRIMDAMGIKSSPNVTPTPPMNGPDRSPEMKAQDIFKNKELNDDAYRWQPPTEDQLDLLNPRLSDKFKNKFRK